MLFDFTTSRDTRYKRARRTRRIALFGIVVCGLAAFGTPLLAQNTISVPFTAGFVGNRGSSAGTANNVLTYATLGIARTFFIQSSSTTSFELQGNDIPGTLRIVRTNGLTIDMPASANWRNSGGSTYLIGILPRPISPITYTYAGGSIQITDGSSNGGSSVGGYIAAYAGSTLIDGESTSGNAAQSQVLSGLNSYLATVISSRPSGPVTVTALSTSNTTPTISGTANLGAGESLTVVINGRQYSTATSPALVITGTSWSLTLTSPLAIGTYDITATITDANGFTLDDASTNELVVASAGSTVTIGGSFTASNKTYDGLTTATGQTAGLTLSGVTSPDQVSIASVTLAFQTATAANGKTVVISAVTLTGADASSYTVSLTSAPTATATIAAKPITISGVTANNKVYDGTTGASLSGSGSYSGLVNGETYTVSGTPSASFGSAIVATGAVVTVTGYSAPSSNYGLTQPTSLTADITAKPLTIGGSFTANNRAFDGSTAATISTNSLTLVGVVGNDDVSLSNLVVAFNSASIGTDKPVSLTSASRAGAAAGNYSLSLAGAPTTTADITEAGGTVTIGGSFTASNKTYDGLTTATGQTAGLTLSGVTSPDQVSIASVTLAFQTATAANGKTVVISAVTLTGADASSYTVRLTGAPTATANITAKPITISGVTANNKVYDGTTVAVLSGTPRYVGLVNNETFPVVGSGAAAFANANVGAGKTVTTSGYAAPTANYSLSANPSLTANISARTLTIDGSFTVESRFYDGSVATTLVINALRLLGVVQPDVVQLTGISAAFVDPGIGNDKLVVLLTAALGGSGAGNYTLSTDEAPTTRANILPASPPSAPRNIVVVPGNGEVTITWSVPTDEGCQSITAYSAGYSTDDGQTWSSVTVPARTPLSTTLTRLTNNRPYFVRVAATNTCGTGSYATSSSSVVPIGPTTGGDGKLLSAPPGGATTTTPSGTGHVTIEVVQDTMVRLTAGTVILTLRATDTTGAPIPVDSTYRLTLEQGGRGAASGRGFLPGSYVTLYIYASGGQPILVANVSVAADGSFDSTFPIPSSFPSGSYTLQVNGIDPTDQPRSVAIGVEIDEQPADLVLSASPSQQSPAVGDTITITLTVLNQGLGAALEVVIPRGFGELGFRVVNATPLDGVYDPVTLEWRIARIAAGASARLVLTTIVVPPDAIETTQP